MDILSFYKLKEEPFQNAPVPKFFYNSAGHSQALVRLKHCAQTMKGLGVCIGDIGTGKTTLARYLLEKFPQQEYASSLLVIVQANVHSTWFFQRIAQQIGIEQPAAEKTLLMQQLYRRLFQLYEQGKKTVIIIDEAQMLRTREIMEEIRGLLNLEVPSRKLVTFLLFALPELEGNLKMDPPLLQRVSVKFNLNALDRLSTYEYMRLRLSKAGGEENIFSVHAVDHIFRYSKGIPRLINTICDNALLEGVLNGVHTIDENIIHRVASDLALRIDSPSSIQSPLAPAIAYAEPFEPSYIPRRQYQRDERRSKLSDADIEAILAKL
jgi:type II secretory pathway predicted ATPase ExeA